MLFGHNGRSSLSQLQAEHARQLVLFQAGADDAQTTGVVSAAGRFAMVCCAEDTTFLGVLIKGPEVKGLKTRDWVRVTGRVQIEKVSLYQGEGPVLHILDVQQAEPPKDELVYF